ncbi:MAG: glycosyltransferase family protein, partial [Phycisphaerae bacterium]
ESHVPASLKNSVLLMGQEWIAQRQLVSNIGSFGLLQGLAERHAEAVEWLLASPAAYFDALECMWAFSAWQRVFYTRYLARHVSVAVFGHEQWREVGIPGGGWVEHDDLPSVYAQGRLAMNITQRGDEAGVAHKPFQIASSGVAMIHNSVPGFAQCFVPDVEAGVFEGPASLLSKVDQLLKNEDLRRGMAESARERTVREHTWQQRLPQMFALAGIRLCGVTQALPADTMVVRRPVSTSGGVVATGASFQ